MKTIFKTICLFFACVICLCSCTGSRTKAHENFKNVSGTPGMIREIYEFEYNGHKYINFEGNTVSVGISVVHNPDCPCLKSN